jgi:outer membrane lipoprotein-sorting protein
MKILAPFFLIALMAMSSFAADFSSGNELIAAMHNRYAGKWYKTLTFVQKTTNFKPDGTSTVATWYEAMSVPGNLRIDFDPAERGDGILFANGKVYSFREGKLAMSRAFLHPLMVLGFDVYAQPAEKTIDQLKEMNIDLSSIHQEKWQGRSVYVVGANAGDLNTPQFWIDKKELYFVRLIELKGKDKKTVNETQFNKYQKVKGGGWVSAEVQFFVDGKPATTEEYSDIQTGANLDASLWDPEKWMTADRTYFKKK